MNSYLTAATFRLLLGLLVEHRGRVIKLKTGQEFEILNYDVEVVPLDNVNKVYLSVLFQNPMGHVLQDGDEISVARFMDFTNDSLSKRLEWIVERIYKQIPDTKVSKRLYAK